MTILKRLFTVDTKSDNTEVELTTSEKINVVNNRIKETEEDLGILNEQLENLKEIEFLEEELAKAKAAGPENIKGPVTEAPVTESPKDTTVDSGELPTPNPGEEIKLTSSDVNLKPVKPTGKKTTMAEAMAKAIKK